jgi:uncharacterized protein YegP (UPF0339 family)
MYKFKIIKNEKGFRAQFIHKNGNVIFWTESYASKASAKNAVKGIVENAAKAVIEEVDETKKVAAPKTVAKKVVAKKVATKK